MNEFEAATIAFQNASLAATYWATYVRAGIAGLVGLVQCALIAWGLRLMRQSARYRDQQHEENMLALRTLIERTAPRQV